VVFFDDPFRVTSKAQQVCHIEILVEQGNRKTGWVWCGNPLFGTLMDEIEVMWET